MPKEDLQAHFWTLRHFPEIADWDPDAEPAEYQDGFGHSFLELFVRMRRAGYPVTIGASVRRGLGPVVVCLEELSEWNRQGVPRNNLALCRSIMARGRRALVVIRNDVHPHIRAPLCTSLEMMPTTASITDPRNQMTLPLLPQRGLVTRDAARAPRVEVIGIKAYQANVPEWISSLTESLKADDIQLRVDDGETVSWSDFRDLDAALCVHPDEMLGDPRRKPATKLINAWAAGVIPVCEPNPAYTELAELGVDALFIDAANSIPDLLARVNADPDWAGRLLAASRQRGAAFTATSVTSLWADALASAPPMRRLSLAAETVTSTAQLLFGPAIGRRVAKALEEALA